MNTLVKMLIGAALLGACGVSMAKCPANLNADEMYQCIVTENAGYEYLPADKQAQDPTDTAQQSTQADTRSQDDNVQLAHKGDAK